MLLGNTVPSVNVNEGFIDEGMKLLRLHIDDLYATLGGQTLGRSSPGRAAGIISYVSGLRSSCEARDLYKGLPTVISAEQLGSELRVIYDGLREDGRHYLAEVREDLRKSLCSENIFAVTETVNRSSLEVVTVIVGAALRLPRDFNSIAVTVAAIVLKAGLRDFCADRTTPA
jgi:hypothetical protein